MVPTPSLRPVLQEDTQPAGKTCEDGWWGRGKLSRDVTKGRVWMSAGEGRKCGEQVTMEAKGWQENSPGHGMGQQSLRHPGWKKSSKLVLSRGLVSI